MNIETYISLGLSVLAAIGASYTYVVHTRRLNSQQKQINDYQLKHLKEEEDEKKKALIQCCNISMPGTQMDILQIQNIGSAAAYNINFDIDEEDIQFNMSDELFPFPKLLPGQSIDIRYYYGGNNEHQTIPFTWDDDYEKGEKIEQVLSL